MSRRFLPVCLFVGVSLLMTSSIGSAAEGPWAELARASVVEQKQPVGAVPARDERESGAGEGMVELVQTEGKIEVDGEERSVAPMLEEDNRRSGGKERVAELVRAQGGVTVDGQVGSVGTVLDEGDCVSVVQGGFATIEYSDGCRYTVEGREDETRGGCHGRDDPSRWDYVVNHAQCICLENIPPDKYSKHAVATGEGDAVAELGRIEGTVKVDEGTGFSTEGMVGTELAEGDRVMTMEDSNALVEYDFGCDYTVQEEEVYTVDPEDCCLAMLPPPVAATTPPVAVSDDLSDLIPPLVALGILGLSGVDGDSRLPPISADQ